MKRHLFNWIKAAIVAAIVLVLGGVGFALLFGTWGTGAGWAMALIIIGIIAVIVAVGPLARRQLAGPATWVTIIGIILGAVGAWWASRVDDWGALVAAAGGIVLLLAAMVIEYVWARYFYSDAPAAPAPPVTDDDDAVIDAVLVDD
ncbi:hypothetical protein KA043_01840 [Candidatus Saccharibacteria bacterium]|nr:hypothetical protein [Candidatus Saccharibacteria bacterium]